MDNTAIRQCVRGHQPAVHLAGISAGASVNQIGSHFSYHSTLETSPRTMRVMREVEIYLDGCPKRAYLPKLTFHKSIETKIESPGIVYMYTACFYPMVNARGPNKVGLLCAQ